ncbi:outer membrane lipoprotein carrier protein LolA [Geminicoccaceae bacterium 1502E]|nr:outer membrane lipoprotein carrier protein LolA [Geminicoccaceae bacterium 1502E]
MIHRRALLGGLALAALLPGAPGAAVPPDEAALLEEIERYLNNITTLKARFTQIAPSGEMATGMLYLQRPGRLRFDYDPPSKILLIATDWRLVFVDSSIRQVNTLPLAETPLGFILDRQVRLGDGIEAVDVRSGGGEVAVSVARSGQAEQGQVTLYFAKAPMELRRWAVTDAQGLVTTVILEELQTGMKLDQKLFRFRDPEIFGWPEG